MKYIVSWSGGKDCCLALHKQFLLSPHKAEYCLLNSCDADGKMSRSHGLNTAVIAAQAQAMGLALHRAYIYDSYETSFKDAIAKLKKQGASSMIFGDIYLEAHRVWLERVCKEMEILPLFPLWGMDLEALMQEFISEYEAIIVSVRKDCLGSNWLARPLDASFIQQLKEQENPIDLCGEKGEYHSLVTNGTLFEYPLPYYIRGEYSDNKHYFLNVSSEIPRAYA